MSKFNSKPFRMAVWPSQCGRSVGSSSTGGVAAATVGGGVRGCRGFGRWGPFAQSYEYVGRYAGVGRSRRAYQSCQYPQLVQPGRFEDISFLATGADVTISYRLGLQTKYTHVDFWDQSWWRLWVEGSSLLIICCLGGEPNGKG